MHAAVPNDPLTGQPFPGNRIPADRISPAGRAFLNLLAAERRRAGKLQQLGHVSGFADQLLAVERTRRLESHQRDAVDAALHARQLEERLAQHPGQPLGRRPVPGVDSNWDQPSKSFVVSLNQTLGNTATNTLQFSYSANKIEITRGGEDPRCTTRSSARWCRSIRTAPQYGNETGIRCSGAAGLPGALERSAVPQQSGSVHHQGRLHEGLRQALRQGGRARELQQEERGHRRQRLEPALARSGVRPGPGWAARPATFWRISCAT